LKYVAENISRKQIFPNKLCRIFTTSNFTNTQQDAVFKTAFTFSQSGYNYDYTMEVQEIMLYYYSSRLEEAERASRKPKNVTAIKFCLLSNRKDFGILTVAEIHSRNALIKGFSDIERFETG
jgi:hypothetical protein